MASRHTLWTSLLLTHRRWSSAALCWHARSTLSWLHSPIRGAYAEPSPTRFRRHDRSPALARDLATRGLIEHPRLLIAWARVTGQGKT